MKRKKAKSLKVLRNTKDFCFHIYARQRKKKERKKLLQHLEKKALLNITQI